MSSTMTTSMKLEQKALAGGYAPIYADVTPEPVIEAFAVQVPHVEFVELHAPATLPGGYELSVQVGGDHMVVLVPEGGVKEGQLFRAQVLNQAKPTPTINNNPHNIPVGQWRNGLFECCAHGCCHPMCCLASWCRPLALGQVMTRMNLDPCGNPDVQGTSRTCGPFKVMVALTVALYCGYYICLVIAAPINTASNAGGYGASGEDFGPNDIVTALYQIFSIAISMYFLIVTCKTRAHLRRTYNIPETSCNGCEDCCCAYWCGCCTLAQMARHTADYETYPAACCSETGLNNRAPPTLARAPPTLAPHIV